MTPEELDTLKNPPQSLRYWADGCAADRLAKAGFLKIKTRTDYIPAMTIHYADFELTDAGRKALAESQ